MAMPVFRPKAVGQVGGAVELAAADVDVALRGLAERDDARVQTVDQRAERQEIEGAVLPDIQTVSSFISVVRPD